MLARHPQNDLAGLWGQFQRSQLAALTVRWDLLSGQLAGPYLQAGRAHESRSPLQQQAMPRGSLWIADLGYFALKGLLILAQQGIYFLLRDIAGVLVWDEHGHLMDLLTDLPQEEGELLDQPVWLGASKQVAARLIAVKVPKEVIEQRREQRKRTGPQAEQTDQSAALGSGAVDGTAHQCADGHAECRRCLWAAESEMAN